MFNKKLLERVKHSVVVISLGILIGVVPFYFQTKAMTEDNHEAVQEHNQSLSDQREQLNRLEVREAINDTEIEQIKESLERIEKKIDRLIEREQTSE